MRANRGMLRKDQLGRWRKGRLLKHVPFSREDMEGWIERDIEMIESSGYKDGLWPESSFRGVQAAQDARASRALDLMRARCERF